MNWQSLSQHVPFVLEEMRQLDTELGRGDGWHVSAHQPGKYARRTRGGDFRIDVWSHRRGWNARAFTHVELFEEFERYQHRAPDFTRSELAPILVGIVADGIDPTKAPQSTIHDDLLEPHALLVASQALALAESRRYGSLEWKGGGKYLPTRFALGIVFGRWTSEDAAKVTKSGAGGVEVLEKYAPPGSEPGSSEVLAGRLRVRPI